MKKIVAVSLAMLLLAFAVVPAFAEGATTMYVNTPKHGTLTLRSFESTSAPALVLIPYRAAVTVLENRGEFSVVNYNGFDGYVLTKYLSKTRPSADDPVNPDIDYSKFKPVVGNMYKTVTPSRPAGFVNLRWAPSKSVRVLEKMYMGDTVKVLATSRTWYQVQDVRTGVVGFMMAEFLK